MLSEWTHEWELKNLVSDTFSYVTRIEYLLENWYSMSILRGGTAYTPSIAFICDRGLFIFYKGGFIKVITYNT